MAFTTSWPLSYLTEDGVLPVQIFGGDVGDEELASVGVRPGVGHGERADFVTVLAALNLIFEPIAGTAVAGALRIAALDHEVGDHPVELRAVVELIAGKEYEIIYRLGRFFGEQLADDLAA